MINVSLPTFCMTEELTVGKNSGGVGKNRHMAWEWFGLLAIMWEDGKPLCIIQWSSLYFLETILFVCDGSPFRINLTIDFFLSIIIIMSMWSKMLLLAFS